MNRDATRRVAGSLVVVAASAVFLSACGGSGSSTSASSPSNPAPTATVRLATGFVHTCAIRANNTLKCWGGAGNGQLGLGDMNTRGTLVSDMGDVLPVVNVGTGRVATQIVAGRQHTCALLDNSQLKCWGWNSSGQLGRGNTADWGNQQNQMGDNLGPINLGTGRTAVQISAGDIHTCAVLDNGQAKCWGANASGQLGFGDTTNRGTVAGQMGDSLPAINLGAGRTVRQISAGGSHTCALLDTNQIKCWGDNSIAQLGVGDLNNRGVAAGQMGDNLPVVNLGTNRTAVYVAAGFSHTCALLDNAQIKCWGSNSAGQLGLGDQIARGINANEMGDNLPMVNLGSGRSVRQLVSSRLYTCARLDNNQVKCWGSNLNGNLGLGDTALHGDQANEMGDNLPAVDLGSGRTATEIMAHDAHTCAWLDNGQLKCWGINAAGNLGLGDSASRGDQAGEMGDNLPAVNLGN